MHQILSGHAEGGVNREEQKRLIALAGYMVRDGEAECNVFDAGDFYKVVCVAMIKKDPVLEPGLSDKENERN